MIFEQQIMSIVFGLVLCFAGITASVDLNSNSSHIPTITPHPGYVAPSEVQALNDLYAATNGINWFWRLTNDSEISDYVDDDYLATILEDKTNITYDGRGAHWNFTGYHSPCSESWQGIQCFCYNTTTYNSTTGSEFLTNNCTIQSISLIAYNLDGTLPDTLSLLTNLTRFDVEYNNITSTIPVSITQLQHIRFLQLGNNNITGSVPPQFGDMQSLRHLHLESNSLSGTFPVHLCNLTHLQYLSVADNLFHGPIPPLIGNMTALRILHLDDNRFTGEIPVEFIHLGKNMKKLYVNGNRLTGSIEHLRNLTNINYLYLFDNQLTGTLPSWLGEIRSLFSLEVGDNQFVGSLPPSLCGARGLAALVVNSNYLTGTIMPCIAEFRIIGVVSMFDNYFTGSIPGNFSTRNVLETLLLNDNMLTGTMPSLNNSIALQFLYVQNNKLHGSLSHVFNNSNQRVLHYLDFSNNHFTGTIPTNMFALQSLESFAAGSNCFSGSISEHICDAKLLTFLDLDGLHTADKCQIRFFYFLDTYRLESITSGSIPSCLFTDLRFLQTLHLSGNGLVWQFPSGLEISPKIQDLSMSHNMLYGTIPDTVQGRTWKNLDLGYNRFTGTLHSNLTVEPGSTLSLLVNRLSGNIPHSLKYATNIDILDTNVFGCDLDRSALPANDANANSYECGSNTFNQAFVLWGAMVGLLVATMLFVRLIVRAEHVNLCCGLAEAICKYNRKLGSWMAVYNADHVNVADAGIDIVEYGAFVDDLRMVFLRATLVIVVGLLPIYTILSVFYSTHTYKYAWNVSVMYLSGQLPAMLLLLMFSLFLAYILLLLRTLLLRHVKAMHGEALASSDKILIGRRAVTLGLVAMLNCSLMLVVNGAYVYSVFEYDSFYVVLIQLVIALFKIFWNEFCLSRLVTQARRFYSNYLTDEAISQRLKITSLRKDRHRSSSKSSKGGSITAASSDVERGRPHSTRSVHSEESSDERIHNPDTNRSVITDRDTAVTMDTKAQTEQTMSRTALETNKFNREEDARDMPILTFIVIFNSIIAPCLANMVLSSQCYERVFVKTAPITSLFPYSVCKQDYTKLITNVFCRKSVEITESLTTSYDPPFIYKYQCSSSFINNYASVYVYMFLISAFGKPLALLAAKYVYDWTKLKGLKYILRLFLNVLLRIDANRNALKTQKVLFRKERFILNTVSATSVLLTFGVVFPPLAVVVCLSIFSHTYVNQLIIGKFLCMFKDEEERAAFVHTIGSDCAGSADLFRYSLLLMVPFTSFFYGFYILDIYGDEVGWHAALWAAVLMFAVPLIYYFLYRLYSLYTIFAEYDQANVSNRKHVEWLRKNAAAVYVRGSSLISRRSSLSGRTTSADESSVSPSTLSVLSSAMELSSVVGEGSGSSSGDSKRAKTQYGVNKSATSQSKKASGGDAVYTINPIVISSKRSDRRQESITTEGL